MIERGLEAARPRLVAMMLLLLGCGAWSEASAQEFFDELPPEPSAPAAEPTLEGEDQGSGSQPSEEPVRTGVAKPSVKRDKVLEAERAEVEALIHRHLEHSTQRQIDAFLADFVPLRVSDGMLRRYAERVFALPEFRIELVELKVSKLRAKTANASVLLRCTWMDASGAMATALSELVMRFSKTEEGWRIESTGRARLDESFAQPLAER